jgi:hypothetical protein
VRNSKDFGSLKNRLQEALVNNFSAPRLGPPLAEQTPDSLQDYVRSLYNEHGFKRPKAKKVPKKKFFGKQEQTATKARSGTYKVSFGTDKDTTNTVRVNFTKAKILGEDYVTALAQELTCDPQALTEFLLGKKFYVVKDSALTLPHDTHTLKETEGNPNGTHQSGTANDGGPCPEDSEANAQCSPQRGEVGGGNELLLPGPDSDVSP